MAVSKAKPKAKAKVKKSVVPELPRTDPLLDTRPRLLSLSEVLDSLVLDGMISPEEANIARAEASMLGTVTLHPLVHIANQKIKRRNGNKKELTVEVLTKWLAKKIGMTYKKIDSMKVDVNSVTQVVAHAYAKRNKILPIDIQQDKIIFATAEPFQNLWMEDLAQILRKEIIRVVSSPLDVNRLQLEFYRVTQSMAKASSEHEKSKVKGAMNFEQLLKLGASNSLTADDHHIVHIVDWLLQFAFEQRASDIHLEPRRDMSHVRFRIDGHLRPVYEMPTPVMTAVTSRIKILGRMDVAEKRRPQDGRIKTLTPTGLEVELRLSTMPTAFGEKCVMRIFDPDVVAKDFRQLGFGQKEVEIWQRMVNRPHGIVLVTGPTGSGKTTTLYSTLKNLAKPELNVCTVEDPIEMIAHEFNQMQVQPKIDLTFAQGVRTLMRQDPDIIMIGEIRDLETAEMAIQASLTGHLVLSTLHTNDAPSAVTRLMDLGIPYYLVQSTLAGVTAQRLVRKLCPHCKTSVDADAEAWTALTYPAKYRLPDKVCAPVGCLECRKTGFLGRTGIYEMMEMDGDLRRIIKPEISAGELRRQAKKSGMASLRLGAAKLVQNGLTTMKEALEVVPPSYD